MKIKRNLFIVYQNQLGNSAYDDPDTGVDHLLHVLLRAIKELNKPDKPLYIMDIQRFISNFFENDPEFAHICPECKTTLGKRLDLKALPMSVNDADNDAASVASS